jgi:hypothetical protein
MCFSSDKKILKYSCNKDVGKCVVDLNGSYDKEDTCNNECIKVSPKPGTSTTTSTLKTTPVYHACDIIGFN